MNYICIQRLLRDDKWNHSPSSNFLIPVRQIWKGFPGYTTIKAWQSSVLCCFSVWFNNKATTIFSFRPSKHIEKTVKKSGIGVSTVSLIQNSSGHWVWRCQFGPSGLLLRWGVETYWQHMTKAFRDQMPTGHWQWHIFKVVKRLLEMGQLRDKSQYISWFQHKHIEKYILFLRHLLYIYCI